MKESPLSGDFWGFMSDMGIAAIAAPRDERAVMVFESGVTVSLRLKSAKS